jgi:phenylpyruvate tautomerase PptA (4-oxalocrotonate tautomerase family)
MVQVIVNAHATWSEDLKQELATGLTEVIRRATGDSSEISIWFQSYSDPDVFVGAEVKSEKR